MQGVRWIELSDSVRARRTAAGALVAILLGRPQMAVDAPAALRSGTAVLDPDGAKPEQNTLPIHYTDVGEAFSSLRMPVKPAHPTPRQAWRAYVAHPNNRQKPAAPGSSGPRSRPMAKRTRRPGKGGRQPSLHIHTPTTATQRLYDTLGPPLDVIPAGHGAITKVWRLPAADQVQEGARVGAVVGRLSSREMQGGETIGGQIQDGMRMAEENGLIVGYVIASTDFYSELAFEDRTDFDVIDQLLKSRDISWVAFREPDRVGRKIITCELFYEMLGHLGGELWLADLGRRVDWQNDADAFAVGAKNLLGQMERNKIRQRTQGALRRRWLEEGRGWPGAKRFGFRRNPRTKFLEIDPEQWPAVVFLHENYALATTRGNGRHVGVAALGQMLLERFGFELADDRIRVLLKDPIYVDGTYIINCHGHPIACEPIPLSDKAVPLDIFQANQELMAVRRGANNATPIGTYPLNGLKIIHARCRDEINPRNGRRATMKVRAQNGCPPRLYHDHFTPTKCRGYTLDPDVILSAVIGELLRLADNLDLQRAWALAARPNSVAQAQAYTEGQLNEMRAQLANLEAQRDALASDWARDVATGDRTANLDAFRELHSALDAEAGRLHAELDVATARESSRGRERRKPTFGSGDDELRQALAEVLTVELPEGQTVRVRRMAVIEACLSAIEIHDVPCEDGAEADGPAVELVLIGHLMPPGEIRAGKRRNGQPLPVSPLDSARPLLEAHIREREGAPAAADADIGSTDPADEGLSTDSQTSVQGVPYKEVRELFSRGDATPQRRRPSKRHYIPCWRSPRLPLVTTPRQGYKWRRWADEECTAALFRAAAELREGQRLTEGRYEALAEAADGEFPSITRMREAAMREGLGFAPWRNLHLHGLAGEAGHVPLSPWSQFSDEQCLQAMHDADRDIGPDCLLTDNKYRDWARGSLERPPRTRIESAAAERGLSFVGLRAQVLGNPWDLDRVRAAVEVADANVDALAAEPGPNQEWARLRRARRHIADSTGYRNNTDDWQRALGSAACEHPTMAQAKRCADHHGLHPAQLFARIRNGDDIPSQSTPESPATPDGGPVLRATSEAE